MSFQAIKIGQSPAYVKSFRWVKPGNAEAIVVQEAVKRDDPAPSMPSLPIFNMAFEGYREEFEEGVGTRYWTFRSGQTIPSSPTDPNSGPNEIWTCDIVASENPITSHPDIKQIMDSFGGVLRHGRVEFAPKLPSGDVNPFYMVETYFAPGVTMSLQKNNTGSISANVIGPVGHISRPSDYGSPFPFNGTGNWLLTEHSARRWGSDRSESLSWRYAPGGWQPEVYDASFWGK